MQCGWCSRPPTVPATPLHDAHPGGSLIGTLASGAVVAKNATPSRPPTRPIPLYNKYWPSQLCPCVSEREHAVTAEWLPSSDSSSPPRSVSGSGDFHMEMVNAADLLQLGSVRNSASPHDMARVVCLAPSPASRWRNGLAGNGRTLRRVRSPQEHRPSPIVALGIPSRMTTPEERDHACAAFLEPQRYAPLSSALIIASRHPCPKVL